MLKPARNTAAAAVFTANNVANPTALSPTLPTRTRGDVLLCFAWSRSITATVSTPGGWSLLTGFPLRSATASGGSLYVFADIVDGSEAAPTITWTGLTTGTSGDASGAVIISYSGADVSQGAASVLDGSATSSDQAGSTTTVTVPSITTALQNSLRIAFVIKLLESSAATWTPPASFQEDLDVNTTTGTGHWLEISSFVVAATGATGTTTAAPSVTTSSRAFGVSFALKRAIPHRHSVVSFQDPGLA